MVRVLQRGGSLFRIYGAGARCHSLRSLSIVSRQNGGGWREKGMWGGPKLTSVVFAAGASVLMTSGVAFAEYSPISENGIRISEDIKSEIKSPKDIDVVLYQYQPCPFCNKVRAFLDLNKIPYKVVEVDPLRKTEIKWSEYKKVPVVVVNGRQLNESTEIIATLSTLLNDKPIEDQFSADDKKWLSWLDDHFVHLLPSNIYRTTGESIQTFDYLTTEGNFSWWARESARYVGALAMYMVAKRLKKKYEISDDPREDLYTAVNCWTDAVDEKGGKFLGGSEPSIADVAVFGVMRSLTNFDTFNDVMTSTKVKPWYERMQAAVGESARIQE